MNTSTIRKKLQEYIQVADDKKVKAIYTIVESDLNEMNQWWNDECLIDELDKRSADLKSGKDKGVEWNELKKNKLAESLNAEKSAFQLYLSTEIQIRV